ncbi:MAG: hypothetical protein A2494_00040 [Candidatus Lloydbacteria bacterium RIFOXYC12_FULL_46_25]|uniref:Transmembrane protein n=1 Tax=Candidatus Lloydbacteria bacterium RIFOXYC12_FULL_46_25 TaxID=1798670 RepID=A0A1G2DUL0_9BACT|nr:MAG: hypothetical protein A2494_00040 [Candidatus Lloydbacteria bacterium RIFOXYC12_FULL_46_25]
MEELKQEDPLTLVNAESENDQNECRLCKFVFAFALVGALLVIVFTYFFKLHTPPAIEPLPQEQIHPVSDTEWQSRILELKNTAGGKSPATSTPL